MLLLRQTLPTARLANVPKTQFENRSTAMKFNTPTSSLGHNKASVLYRQPVRHKSEEL